MEVHIKAITPQCSEDLEPSAAASTFWALPPGYEKQNSSSKDPVFDKQVWLQNVFLEWGICGYTAFVGTGDAGTRPVPAATVFFAPARYMQGIANLPTAPISPDAILLSTVHVAVPYMGLYLEHQLIDTVLTEAHRRGVKAVEAFARVEDFDEELARQLSEAPWPTAQEEPEEPKWTPEEQNPTSKETAGEARDDLPEETSEDTSKETSEGAAGSEGIAGLEGAVGGTTEGQKYRYSALESLKYVPESYRGWKTAAETHGVDEDILDSAPMLSEDILEAEGFKVVKHHRHFPRYRFEISGSHSLFGDFAEEDHAQVNGPEKLSTVIGGNRAPKAPGVLGSLETPETLGTPGQCETRNRVSAPSPVQNLLVRKLFL